MTSQFERHRLTATGADDATKALRCGSVAGVRPRRIERRRTMAWCIKCDDRSCKEQNWARHIVDLIANHRDTGAGSYADVGIKVTSRSRLLCRGRGGLV